MLLFVNYAYTLKMRYKRTSNEAQYADNEQSQNYNWKGICLANSKLTSWNLLKRYHLVASWDLSPLYNVIKVAFAENNGVKSNVSG